MPLAPHERLALPHPFDLVHGVDTSGAVPADQLIADPALAHEMHGYEPVQPSILRQAIDALALGGEIAQTAFLDLGCGKGRAMLVASEYHFARIGGIDLAPSMIEASRANIARMQPPIPTDVWLGDATSPPVLANRMVLFLYNPFPYDRFRQLIAHIETHMIPALDHLFVIYHNAYAADLFDASPALERWSAALYACDPSERGTGYDTEGITAIWQSRVNARPSPHKNRTRRIRRIGQASTQFGFPWFF